MTLRLTVYCFYIKCILIRRTPITRFGSLQGDSLYQKTINVYDFVARQGEPFLSGHVYLY